MSTYRFIGALLCITGVTACGAHGPEPEERTSVRHSAIEAEDQFVKLPTAIAEGIGAEARIEVGQLVPSEHLKYSSENFEPPYDFRGRGGRNAEILDRAKAEAEAYGKAHNLVPAAVTLDSERRIYVDFVKPGWVPSKSDEVLTAPASTPTTAPDVPKQAIPKGLSHNNDNRYYLGYSFLDNSTSLSRIGQVTALGSCTGALIGRRLVLTGAHCVVNSLAGWPTTTFTPRRRGSVAPYGSSTEAGMVFPWGYLTNNCHTFNNATNGCVKYDWAVMILPNSPGFSSHPGWMGFAVYPDANPNWSIDNVGYPSCGSQSMPPPNCQFNQPYGDTLNCSGVAPVLSDASTSNWWPHNDGSFARMDTGCDTSPGHSGGPVYTFSLSGGPHVFANTVWNTCWQASCQSSTTLSSGGTRINGTMFAYLLSLRSTYP